MPARAPGPVRLHLERGAARAVGGTAPGRRGGRRRAARGRPALPRGRRASSAIDFVHGATRGRPGGRQHRRADHRDRRGGLGLRRERGRLRRTSTPRRAPHGEPNALLRQHAVKARFDRPRRVRRSGRPEPCPASWAAAWARSGPTTTTTETARRPTSTGGGRGALMANERAATWASVDVTADAAGLDFRINSNAATWFDYDNDGVPRSLRDGVLRRGARPAATLETTRIMHVELRVRHATAGRNRLCTATSASGTFEEVTEETGIGGDPLDLRRRRRRLRQATAGRTSTSRTTTASEELLPQPRGPASASSRAERHRPRRRVEERHVRRARRPLEPTSELTAST